MQLFYEQTIYFALFSVCGWICESVFCSFKDKKIVNRGFLNGPACPVYGFGGVIVVFILAPLREHLFVLFISGMICTTILEYMTSWVLEKLFQTTWWDYSDLRFHIKGRVCLRFSVVFGLLSVIAVQVLYPPFHFIMEAIPHNAKPILAWILIGVFVTDCAYTAYAILSLNGKLKELNRVSNEIKQKLEAVYHTRLTQQEWGERLRQDRAKWTPSLREGVEELMSRLEQKRRAAARQFQHRRLLRAFPNMKSTRYHEQLSEIKELWQELKNREKKKKSKKIKKDRKKS